MYTTLFPVTADELLELMLTAFSPCDGAIGSGSEMMLGVMSQLKECCPNPLPIPIAPPPSKSGSGGATAVGMDIVGKMLSGSAIDDASFIDKSCTESASSPRPYPSDDINE